MRKSRWNYKKKTENKNDKKKIFSSYFIFWKFSGFQDLLEHAAKALSHLMSFFFREWGVGDIHSVIFDFIYPYRIFRTKTFARAPALNMKQKCPSHNVRHNSTLTLDKNEPWKIGFPKTEEIILEIDFSFSDFTVEFLWNKPILPKTTLTFRLEISLCC